MMATDFRDMFERSNATPEERAVLARAWRAIKEETGDDAASFGRDDTYGRWMLDQILLRYIRSRAAPKVALKDATTAAAAAASMRKRAEKMSADLRDIAAGFHDITDFGLNMRAYGAFDAVAPLLEAARELEAKVAAMAEGAAEAFPRESQHEARREFLRAMFLTDILETKDLDHLEAICVSVAHAVEGKIGKGEGAWLRPMLNIIAAEHDLHLSNYGFHWQE